LFEIGSHFIPGPGPLSYLWNVKCTLPHSAMG
jgi:hypothetical protein